MNKLIVTHVVKEFLGKGNLRHYDEIVSPHVEVHCPPSWKEVHDTYFCGSHTTKVIDEAYVKAFQFKEMYIHEMLTSPDKVAVRWSGQGVNGGAFFSLPATYNHFEISGHTIYRLEGGQVVEVWQAWDMLHILKQLKGPLHSNHEFNGLAQKLTSQEKKCLKLLLKGKTAFETSLELHLSKRTVEYYFENIKDKLSCETKREVFKKALAFDLSGLL